MTQLGDRSIESQAQTNIAKCINETEKSLDIQQHISLLASRGSHVKGRSSAPLPSLSLSTYSQTDSEYNSTNEQQNGVDLEGLIQSGNLTLKVTGLRKKLGKDTNDDPFFSMDSLPTLDPLYTLDVRLKTDTTLGNIMDAIKDAGASSIIYLLYFLPTSKAGAIGFLPPTRLYEEPELHISVTEGDSVYDATTPGGLKVNR